MSDSERRETGARPLPRSLDESLAILADSAVAREWFGSEFFDTYVRFKRAELRAVEGLSPQEVCAKYAEIY
jgi:glutamine synthetase